MADESVSGVHGHIIKVAQEAARKAVMALVESGKVEFPRERSRRAARVTVAMPWHNSLRWGVDAVERICRNGIPMVLMFCDTGSEDGSAEYLRACGSWWVKIHPDSVEQVVVLESVPPSDSAQASEAQARAKMFAEAATEYVWCADPDVLLPQGAIRKAVEAMDGDPKLGAVGVQYDRDVDHVKFGAMLVRTELARKLTLTPVGCLCRGANEELEYMGCVVKHLDGVYACHARWEV